MMTAVTIMKKKKKTRVEMFKNMGGNIFWLGILRVGIF